MDRRLLGNILIVKLLVLFGSGLLMYFKPFNKVVASVHTAFGLLFILAMVFHIINNKKPLYNYLSGKRKSSLQKLQSPLIAGITMVVVTALCLNLPIFNEVYNFGNELRNKQLGKSENQFDYQIITLNNEQKGLHFEIELKKGNAFQYPLFAIWLEDSLGNYLETLYISRVIASSSYDYGTKVDGAWKSAVKRRPEALPYWSHKRGIQAADGLYVPLNNSQDIDAVSGATPTGNFIIKSNSKLNKLNNYKVMLEVNQSYDWNTYYSEDRFPDDEIYSGTGQVGQPSLIYATSISPKVLENKSYSFMNLVGHGHHSGKNGTLFTDLSKITTAKEIADRIILSINQTP
ncbi:DUF4405 domain-containing protein [Mangrovimonas futianensis]|uniref:DUF4405 domain-containing protein n=1 Tax=Mangrovimonas futianensis TaxID=2895523 RepID=UPI001E3931D1|nr:DUF4405 domain-containing protein [Mangrovimonas futianensis]MCF1422940.1 hypothetical protein [Mangrovimonas futianensis]